MANQFTLNGNWNSRRLFSEVIGLSDIENPALTLDHRKEIRNKTIEWCQNAGLIHQQRICRKKLRHLICNAPKSLSWNSNINKAGFTAIGKRWRHQSKAVGHGCIEYSMATNTWFEHDHKLPLETMLHLVFGFCNEYSYDEYKKEASRYGRTLSEETISDWEQYCRDVCVDFLDMHYENQGKIGGETSIVQIDEAKIGKRKNHVGRVVEGSWILGMVDMETNEIRFEILPGNRRDEDTLMAAIQKHVLPQTIIVTDQWLGYLNLSRPRTPNGTWYNHLTVNHTYNFVDPLIGANTQMIESNWRALKKTRCSQEPIGFSSL